MHTHSGRIIKDPHFRVCQSIKVDEFQVRRPVVNPLSGWEHVIALLSRLQPMMESKLYPMLRSTQTPAFALQAF